jgi:outer membrane receptor protein involved in Fe transport
MLELNYSLMVAEFLASADFADQISWTRSNSYQGVANVPNHVAALKGAVPIIGRSVTLGARLTGESGRLTREEAATDLPQLRTKPFFYADFTLMGVEPITGIRYNFGVYNAFDWQVELPVSAEYSMRTFAQRGRTFMADVTFQF